MDGDGDVDGVVDGVDGTGSEAADTIPWYEISDDEFRDEIMNSSDEDQNPSEHTFDTALPVKHSYLGSNLEELRGRTLLDDDSYQTLPILPEPGIVLVPGQTLPLSIFYPPTISMLRRAISKDRTFGVVCIRYFSSQPPSLADVGTTAEIYEFQDDDDETAGFKIKAKGRQRFRIIETQRQIDGNVSARVKILPEIVLPDPLVGVHFSSLDRHRKCLPQKKCKLDMRDAIVTCWPSWVHSQYQSQRLVRKITQMLNKLGRGNVALPTDPIELSFWVAQSLPLRDEQKLALLRIDSAIQRLRWELSVLERCKIFCCQKCQTKVAHQRDVFSMSLEGPHGTYVNSGGYVHETVSVYKAKGLKCVSDEPSTEYTWFPGYAWTIAECRQCSTHMGWMFTATRADLRPAKFWGLCRRSLAPRLQTYDEKIIPVM